MDFHTHNLLAPPGTAIVNLPRSVLSCPAAFQPQLAALYSIGIHPWWTVDATEAEWQSLEQLAVHPQIVAIGECGLDTLRGASIEEQLVWFRRHIALAESLEKSLTVHCVRSFHHLLALHKELRPRSRWTVHGFRGGPALARQLLDAGIDLSFGRRYNPASLALTPPDRRHFETDEEAR